MTAFFKKKFIDETLEAQLDEVLKSNPNMPLGENCNHLPNAAGEFGRTKTNPIPVNGVRGEFKYLNRLRCKCDSGLLFHRIGSIDVQGINGNVDIFETVCLRGVHWDLLFLHFYHPRRSILLPQGYYFSDFHPIFSKLPIAFGTNQFDEYFPFGLSKFIIKQMGGPDGKAFAAKYESFVQDKDRFGRTPDQEAKLKVIFGPAQDTKPDRKGFAVDFDYIMDNLLILGRYVGDKRLVIGSTKETDKIVFNFLKKYNIPKEKYLFLEDLITFIDAYIGLKLYLNLKNKKLEELILNKFPNPDNFLKINGYRSDKKELKAFVEKTISNFIKDPVIESSDLSMMMQVVQKVSEGFVYILSSGESRADMDSGVKFLFHQAIVADLVSLADAIGKVKRVLKLE